MTLPLTLTDRIAAAQQALRRHPQGHLDPGYRHAIYAAFGPKSTALSSAAPAGRARRVRLGMLATQHVLPKWQALWPADDMPQRLVRAADELTSGMLDPQVAREFWDAMWARLEELMSEPAYQSATYQDPLSVGVSAAFTLSAALHDEQFDPARIDYALADTDTDVFSKDAAFWASTAYAGPIWEPTTDPQQRRSFWEWWLTEAVPAAWSSVEDRG